MSENNDAAPHTCTGHFEDGRPCTAPAYIGFGLAPKCVQRGCVNYDAGLWCEWVMLVPDEGDPPNFEDEDTNPNYQVSFGGVPLKGHLNIGTFKTQGTQTGRISLNAPGWRNKVD